MFQRFLMVIIAGILAWIWILLTAKEAIGLSFGVTNAVILPVF